MYGTNEYATQRTYSSGGSRRRTWLAAGGALAAVLVMLILVAAACNARSDRPDPLAAGSSPTTTATQSAGGVGAASDRQDGGEQAEGPGNPAPPENPDPPQNPEPPDPGGEDDPEQPVPPLSIQASVDVVTPGGQCFASGTIAVSGGEYPVTVHYQWRRLVQGEGLDGVAVSAVNNHTFTEAGAIQVQTSSLPEDGTNVFLLVTGPKQAGSGLVEYQGCHDGPGDIAPND